MNPYKILPGTAYTDTDSIFTTDILPIGKELGMMKDELNGKIITEAYFLGIKQYGYKYIDNNQEFERSTEYRITFKEIIKLVKGDKLVRNIPFLNH